MIRPQSSDLPHAYSKRVLSATICPENSTQADTDLSAAENRISTHPAACHSRATTCTSCPQTRSLTTPIPTESSPWGQQRESQRDKATSSIKAYVIAAKWARQDRSNGKSFTVLSATNACRERGTRLSESARDATSVMGPCCTASHRRIWANHSCDSLGACNVHSGTDTTIDRVAS